MKKFLFVIIAGTLLLSGCKDSEIIGNSPGTIPNPSESITQISSRSNSEITVSVPESTAGTASTADPSSSVKTPESSSAVSSNIKIPEPPSNKEENELSISITINEKTFSASLYDSETAKAFGTRLPLTLDMSELNGNEKYYYLPDSLPTNSSEPKKINTGDIMLYGNRCLVIFYESFSTSYSYTPIGKIDDPAGLAAALGSGDVRVTFK